MSVASEVLNEESEQRNNVVQIPTPGQIATYGHKIDDGAFYGQAGEFVQMILPHTEADPAALLANFLVGFGSIIGRNALYKVEGAEHYGNLFVVLVGESSHGRKGTSWNRAKEVLALIDPDWAKLRIHSGLSSGEGLIAAVSGTEPNKVDPRLLVYQPEFASTLAVMARQGNNLSPIIRESWDSGSLQTMVKLNPLRAEGAHISMIGHITREELRRNLNNTETGNGFANRFLWIRSERSKYLPDGGSLPESEIVNFASRLRPAVKFAQQSLKLERDSDAKVLWHDEYQSLCDGAPGLVGSVTSRAVPQVLRLSMLYALLDRSQIIRVEHLKAALALWDYAARSAEWVFGTNLGDPVADAILQALRVSPHGMSRSDISALFARNHAANRIEQALGSLRHRGLALPSSQATGGRNAEIWEATPAETKNTKDTNKLEIIR